MVTAAACGPGAAQHVQHDDRSSPPPLPSRAPAVESRVSTAKDPPADPAAVRSFGAAFASDRAVDVDIANVIAEPERFGSDALTMQGKVTAVCQRRGCWLEVAPSSAGGEGCRVVSENHDWFVPRDATGEHARVRGRVEVRTIPAAQVSHMESEGGRFEHKLPDGSARELRIVASGIELSRR